MGTYYSIYAEARVGNKWYNICPLMREDGEITAQPILSGKSMLRSCVDELEEQSYMRGRPDDLSDEIRKIYPQADDEIAEEFTRTITYKEYFCQTMFLVNYGKVVKSRVKKARPTRYKGYVSRYALSSYEIGEDDYISNWISEIEYEKLPEEDKLDYTYYEWNEMGDWYGNFSKICRKVDVLLEIFNEWSQHNIYEANLDERQPSADYVRLIVCAE